MENLLADRLSKLRKEHGYSQEELAEKLNVSRQAISKWERGIASPDTDNLINLADLYHITLDELLRGKTETTTQEKTKVKIGFGGIDVNDGKDEVHVGFDGIHVKDANQNLNVNKETLKVYCKNNRKWLIIEAILGSTLMGLAIIGYLLLGFLVEGGWEMGWLLFLLAIVLTSIGTCIKEKKLSCFAMPILATAVYVFIGMYLGIWHPTWLVFLAIPVYYMISGPVDKAIEIKNKTPEEFVTVSKEDSIDIEETK